MEWQPIETAPKDGTYLMLSDGACIYLALWNGQNWDDGLGTDESEITSDPRFGPNYWMLLPDLPPEIEWETLVAKARLTGLTF